MRVEPQPAMFTWSFDFGDMLINAPDGAKVHKVVRMKLATQYGEFVYHMADADFQNFIGACTSALQEARAGLQIVKEMPHGKGNGNTP